MGVGVLGESPRGYRGTTVCSFSKSSAEIALPELIPTIACWGVRGTRLGNFSQRTNFWRKSSLGSWYALKGRVATRSQRREAQKRLTSPEGRPFSGEGCKAEACLKRPLGKGPSGSEGSRREGIRGPRCAQEPGSGSSHLRRCKDPE